MRDIQVEWDYQGQDDTMSVGTKSTKNISNYKKMNLDLTALHTTDNYIH